MPGPRELRFLMKQVLYELAMPDYKTLFNAFGREGMFAAACRLSPAIVCVFLMGNGVTWAQTYPHKVIRIATTEIGGFPDVVARLIAQRLTGAFRQPVIVENRAIIGVETVAKAPPDGHSLLFYTSVVWLAPLLRDNVSWDPLRDFAPITLIMNSPMVVVVHPSVQAKSITELIALAKARPGQLNYSTSSVGSTNHLAAELFMTMAGVDLVRINYKGTGPSLNGLIGGQVQVTFPSAGSVAPHIRSAKVRALAVTSAQPSALVPGLPTIAASGLPGYEASALTGMFAPARTPAAIVNTLNAEMVRVVNNPDVKERIFDAGGEVIGSSPEEFTAIIKSEIVRWTKVIKDAGIRGE